eukprot:Skav204432  [mRNA]  locus=scaffold1093:68687:69917:- [translate_table: standard]
MEALLKNRDALVAAAAANPVQITTPKIEVNWSTHRKEGMRLKRLMEESAQGEKFPHMKQMWAGSAADRKNLLQQWVSSGGSADCIEADLVIQKSNSHRSKAKRELLTTDEMRRRHIPLEKIRAIVSRGGGVPDEDCPGIPSLTKFWVSTSTSLIDENETRQQSSVRIQADAAASLGASFGLPSASSGGAAAGTDEILRSLEAPAVPDSSESAAAGGQGSTPVIPKAKAKTKAKAKAKAGAKAMAVPGGVTEVAAKTLDDKKSEMSHILNLADSSELHQLP